MKITTIFTVILQLINPIGAVKVYLATKPVVFGGEAVLTCKVGYPLKISNECPVREWSGGRSGRGILYNQFPSNKTKYEERTDEESDKFSLVIKHFDELDVNKNYTCSCGFNSATTTIPLNNLTFISPPKQINMTETPTNDLLTVELSLTGVYPIPKCSLYVDNVETTKSMTSKKIVVGIFYDVLYREEVDRRCGMQTRIHCIFPADINGEQKIDVVGNSAIKCQVTWNITYFPKDFGDDVVLICFVDTKVRCSTLKWKGGPDNTVLQYDGASAIGDKYKAVNKDAGKTKHFSLLIKNVTVVDIDAFYECSCDLYRSRSKQLELTLSTNSSKAATSHLDNAAETIEPTKIAVLLPILVFWTKLSSM